MARTEARIRTAVWRNRDFAHLTRSQQGTYWMVLSQPDMNLAGVVSYMPERWAGMASDDTLLDDLAALQEQRYLLVDADTREVWVRSFARHDGVLKSEKTRAGMWAAFKGLFSERIRAAFIAEIEAEHVTEAREKGWIVEGDLPTEPPPWDDPSYPPLNPPSIPHPEQSDQPNSGCPIDTPSLARAASASVSDSDSDPLSRVGGGARGHPLDGLVTDIERREILAALEQGGIRNPEAYLRTLRSNGDLEAWLTDWRQAHPPKPPTRPWCGTCDETTRLLEDPDDPDAMMRCPRCNAEPITPETRAALDADCPECDMPVALCAHRDQVLAR